MIFKGTVYRRSSSDRPRQPEVAGEREVFKCNPQRVCRIMKETGWESVFCGTLNLRVADGVSDDLSAMRALFFERPEDVKHPTDQRIPQERGRVLLLQSDGVSARRDPGGPGQTGRQPARQEVRGASRSSQADGPSSDRQGQRGRGRRVFRQLRDASAGNPCTRMAAPTLMRGASSSLYKSQRNPCVFASFRGQLDLLNCISPVSEGSELTALTASVTPNLCLSSLSSRRPSPLVLLRFAVPLPSTAVHGPPRVPQSRVRSRVVRCPGSAPRFLPGHGCG